MAGRPKYVLFEKGAKNRILGFSEKAKKRIRKNSGVMDSLDKQFGYSAPRMKRDVAGYFHPAK